ncbi:4-hydroxybenzoate octaprenyltransferase [Sugiyamaella lignohabitans]|uniref:4-hydroxybenzoate polyprenyltransferase, mitochondrial n=1 Tax=Sugiyamaella lignohabitans TaxID=796027 RepID=A0A167F8M1_9ASCO|nr:4-hydroxybenzoate octaprenyltransferase [Sugiyamaella lignohabitans]ANB14963.1 4-hydroxybenzoate octaprenyltransferase [Sugiyamaella lignohabitans]
MLVGRLKTSGSPLGSLASTSHWLVNRSGRSASLLGLNLRLSTNGIRFSSSDNRPGNATNATTATGAASEIVSPMVTSATAAVATPTLPQRFVNSLPLSVKPYAELMRLDKPIGTWLLYSPCTVAITMAAYHTGAPITQTLWMLTLFGIGSVIMRGAGCTINDLLDRNLDNQVERTKTRPLASKAVSVPAAITFLGAQCFAGLGILLSLPSDCFLLGAASLPLVFTYPLFKRFTYYPQVCLSLCFTWGALLGFPAMGVWNWPAMLCLHASSFAWCMIYDTIYAHQDKLYDIKAGIKSTALKWGNKSKDIMEKYAYGQIGFLAAAGVFGGMGPFFFGATVLAAYRVLTMIKKVNLDDPANCWKWFVENINTGHFLWAGASADYLLRLGGLL